MKTGRRYPLPIRVALIAGAATAWLTLVVGGCAREKVAASAPIDPDYTAAITAELRAKSVFPSPAALACAECHRAEFEAWHDSQHAHANRLVSTAEDGAAFAPERTLAHGSFTTTLRRDGEAFAVQNTGPDGVRDYVVAAVIGIEPLRQYLIPASGGRLQVLDVAHDPAHDDWFNVFGDEDRQPHEWGFWGNRGMNWNSRCAACHTTNFRKNYDPVGDRYGSTWDAMGVACAQCHRIDNEAAVAAQAAGGCPVTATAAILGETIAGHAVDNCASCHARREELTGTFQPGDAFADHFRLALADQANVYHADGQVADEDFEYGSLRLSRMGHAGVTCLDCHNPHTGGLVAPVENNALCLSCHAPPGQRNAIPIDVLTHSRHAPGSTGARCVECHMPESTYMQRDPRRDHGFTIPDPILTQELGIPNACNRCHTDRDPAWAAQQAIALFGTDFNHRARTRARIVARARDGDATVVPELLAVARAEEVAVWRASLIALLAPWANHTDVESFLRESLADADPDVRAAAVQVLAPLPGATEALTALRTDPIRLVRLNAAWATLGAAPRAPTLETELGRWMLQNADQPSGATRHVERALAEGRPEFAEPWLTYAKRWDPAAAYPHELAGRVAHALGQLDEAIAELTVATQLEPENGNGFYTLALVQAEAGNAAGALTSLERATELAPDFGRAWYNLGLAYAAQNRFASALAALERAGQLMPTSPEPPYAAATVHARLNDFPRALQAAAVALARDPTSAPLQQLVNQLRAAAANPPPLR